MKTRSHVHQESFPVPPEKLFELLVTPSAIRQWWGASRVIVMAQDGGMWAAVWGADEDDPDYITSAVIATYDPPRRLVLDNYRYYARTGPLPFEVLFVTEFDIRPESGGSILKVTQEGFPVGPEGDEFLRGCDKGWVDTFAGIRRYLSAP